MQDQKSLTSVDEKEVQALKKIRELVNEVYEAKNKLDEAEVYYNKLKSELVALMEASEIDSFEGDNCKAFCKPKTSISLPKDVAIKKKVFEYISKKYGAEVLEEMITINPATFNSWYNAEAEAALNEGNLDFKIVDELKPYEYFSLSLRKKTSRK